MSHSQPSFAVHLAHHREIIEFLAPNLVDELEIYEIGQELLDLIHHRRDSFVLVLDFHRVEHLSSSMLGLMMSLHRAAARQGGEVAVAGLNDAMQEVFRVMRLHRVLRVCETATDVLRKSA